MWLTGNLPFPSSRASCRAGLGEGSTRNDSPRVLVACVGGKVLRSRRNEERLYHK